MAGVVVRTREDVERWLRETDPSRLAALFSEADRVRHAVVGDEIHLRGLIEISNICVRSCTYCGLRRQNSSLRRYRMKSEEILAAAASAAAAGCRTIVLQSGEDPGLRPDFVASTVFRLKSELDVAVTLSLGEQPCDVLRLWRDAGADRYLLKLETSDLALFASLHPGEPEVVWERRLHTLGVLRGLGYQVGSGSLLGVPGQTLASVARDLELFQMLDLDMIAFGPYVPHPDTPLAQQLRAEKSSGNRSIGENGPCDIEESEWLRQPLTGLIAVALSRLLCPEAHIPATTALRMLLGDDALRPFFCGADVLMPDFTPAQYAVLYRIYPGKDRMAMQGEGLLSDYLERLALQGRPVARDLGDRKRL